MACSRVPVALGQWRWAVRIICAARIIRPRGRGANANLLLRRYMIEIWLLQRMVKLSLPIAGETGDADNLRRLQVRGLGCEARRASHPTLFWASGPRTGAREVASASSQQRCSAILRATGDGRRVGTGPIAGETGPPLRQPCGALPAT
jgi:hypothetical protein